MPRARACAGARSRSSRRVPGCHACPGPGGSDRPGPIRHDHAAHHGHGRPVRRGSIRRDPGARPGRSRSSSSRPRRGPWSRRRVARRSRSAVPSRSSAARRRPHHRGRSRPYGVRCRHDRPPCRRPPWCVRRFRRSGPRRWARRVRHAGWREFPVRCPCRPASRRRRDPIRRDVRRRGPHRRRRVRHCARRHRRSGGRFLHASPNRSPWGGRSVRFHSPSDHRRCGVRRVDSAYAAVRRRNGCSSHHHVRVGDIRT